MQQDPLASSRLLLVEPDDSLRELLGEFLGEVGYTVSLAASLPEALAALREETFALVLAHLFMGRFPAGSFTPAHQLRRWARPTPVGLLITAPFPTTEARRAGFAFALPMPFDLEGLLAEVAQAVQQPLSAEDEERVRVVERFFAAREAQDWQALEQLCTEDVVYYPFTPAGAVTARHMQGPGVLRHLIEATDRAARFLTFLHFYYVALPKGLVVRYLRLWTTPEEERRREARVALFHFRGTQICRVGIRPLVNGFQEQSQAG
jgi:CheY-like chemotaxis protein